MEIITARPHRLEDELAQRIGARLQAGERCMVLVPSQETLHTELALMERLAPEGSFDIDVLSPGRLRDRVFERAGRPSRTVFDERGKRMVITGILEREKDSLTVYGRAAENGRESLAAKLSEMIACCKRSGVSAEELRLRAEQAQAPLAGKLADAALVYGRYEEQMAGRLADMEDMLSEVRQRMERSAAVKGQHVFVTGFDMITPDFAEELLCIAKVAASLCLLVESDANGAPDGSLYAPVNASLERLKAAARDQGVPAKDRRTWRRWKQGCSRWARSLVPACRSTSACWRSAPSGGRFSWPRRRSAASRRPAFRWKRWRCSIRRQRSILRCWPPCCRNTASPRTRRKSAPPPPIRWRGFS